MISIINKVTFIPNAHWIYITLKKKYPLMAVLPAYITTLQNSGISLVSQSVAHSQISHKASPWWRDSWVPQSCRRWTEQTKSAQSTGEKTGELFSFHSWTDGEKKQSDNVDVYWLSLPVCLSVCLPTHNLRQKGHLQSAAPMILYIHLNDK